MLKYLIFLILSLAGTDSALLLPCVSLQMRIAKSTGKSESESIK